MHAMLDSDKHKAYPAKGVIVEAYLALLLSSLILFSNLENIN